MFKFKVKEHAMRNSVSRNFLSEIADFTPIHRQNRQVFGPKSRKIRQFLPIFNGKIDTSPQKIQVLLLFYALIVFRIENWGNFKIIFFKIMNF